MWCPFAGVIVGETTFLKANVESDEADNRGGGDCRTDGKGADV